MMSAMEQSLRRALDAGDASDPAFRETIYAASERALERMIGERPMDEAQAQAQRIRLAETINRVEQDYYEAGGGAAAVDPSSAEDPGAWPPADAVPTSRAAADLRSPGADAFRADAGSGANGASPAREAGRAPPPAEAAAFEGAGRATFDPEAPSFLRRSPDPVATERSKAADRTTALRSGVSAGFGNGARASPSRLRRIFAIVVVLAFALLAYLVYGMIYGPTQTPQTGAETSDATSSGSGPSGADSGWIALFDGTQLASIATPTGGRVETVTGTDAHPAVRMSSAGEGGEIEVAVGPGVARALAGETVRVEVTVGSPDGQPREFGVRCLFAGETVCGRQRFVTDEAREAFVFDMVVPRGARKAGSIAFEPGYGEGRLPLDLYGVRARARQAA